jgi:hypothetical protein
MRNFTPAEREAFACLLDEEARAYERQADNPHGEVLSKVLLRLAGRVRDSAGISAALDSYLWAAMRKEMSDEEWLARAKSIRAAVRQYEDMGLDLAEVARRARTIPVDAGIRETHITWWSRLAAWWRTL